MFSAIYLVCFIGEPCKLFVDPSPYPSREECTVSAQGNIDKHQARIATGEVREHTAEYQCVPWDKA